MCLTHVRMNYWILAKIYPFCFFVAIPQALPTVAKEVGVWGLVPTIYNLNKILIDIIIKGVKK